MSSRIAKPTLVTMRARLRAQERWSLARGYPVKDRAPLNFRLHLQQYGLLLGPARAWRPRTAS